jgi:hypothetical protein
MNYESPKVGRWKRRVINLLVKFLDQGKPVTDRDWVHCATVYVLSKLPAKAPRIDGWTIQHLLPNAQVRQRSLFHRLAKAFHA